MQALNVTNRDETGTHYTETKHDEARDQFVGQVEHRHVRSTATRHDAGTQYSDQARFRHAIPLRCIPATRHYFLIDTYAVHPDGIPRLYKAPAPTGNRYLMAGIGEH